MGQQGIHAGEVKNPLFGLDLVPVYRDFQGITVE